MKIIMLAGKGKSTAYIYNGITQNIDIEAVLIADATPAIQLIKRRIKKLGFVTVINQLLFQTVLSKTIAFFSKRLIECRKKQLNLRDQPIPAEKILDVGFVNSDICLKTIIDLNPDVIIVNGTSIIKKKILEATDAIFINTHVGITPQYRGVHGGYWALRNHDSQNFGVTVHKVDSGIDTGDVIYQSTCAVTKKDNFLTYPLYQYALAIPLLVKTIENIKRNQLVTAKKENVKSKLYYHPTMTDYIYGWFKDNIK
ncbi:formyl transferase [Marnyiella aurantia]|uniref:phosphoribosylglycinamide formyltransferase 1 n=1 Tax=Marnyiella aurantia TaxID=2758037 RepID=A0A7D7LT54_9FLAO|nr:formyl transferase [Marnyiella aurantia]MBA5247441.1 formyl transferase [Marnyiella aurantia]QMS99197.1 formyl transferase [Marnyiella aurantia]